MRVILTFEKFTRVILTFEKLIRVILTFEKLSRMHLLLRTTRNVVTMVIIIYVDSD